MSLRTDFDPVLISLLGDGVNRPAALVVEDDRGRLGDRDIALRMGPLLGDDDTNVDEGAGAGAGGGGGGGGEGSLSLRLLPTDVACGIDTCSSSGSCCSCCG